MIVSAMTLRRKAQCPEPRAGGPSAGFSSVAVCGALALGTGMSPAGLQGHRGKSAMPLSSRTSSSQRTWCDGALLWRANQAREAERRKA